MGKVEIGSYFCVTADILKEVLQKCFLSSPLPIHMNFVQIADFDWLNLQKKIFRNLPLRSHKGDEAETLHKCS